MLADDGAVAATEDEVDDDDECGDDEDVARWVVLDDGFGGDGEDGYYGKERVVLEDGEEAPFVSARSLWKKRGSRCRCGKNGSSTQNWLPQPMVLSTQIFPLCATTNSRAIVSPRPVPAGTPGAGRLKNSSKIS